ncbi:MAG TPA: polymer-forming cytoskeletal protein [Terriglobia bacterium]|jgi:cytoskeletal protein CcmA (bactofilin family)|nr:polymer-forming cytoskeletal protein [Terriglobia bacterium]
MDLSIGKHRAISANGGDNHSNMVALVGPGTEFEGTLRAGSGQVCLDATFKGTATSDGTISIDYNGDVAAELTAKVISISGKLKGTAKASERLEIRSRGIVLGDISTPVLVVEPGGYFDGQCHMPIPESDREQIRTAVPQDIAL